MYATNVVNQVLVLTSLFFFLGQDFAHLFYGEGELAEISEGKRMMIFFRHKKLTIDPYF